MTNTAQTTTGRTSTARTGESIDHRPILGRALDQAGMLVTTTDPDRAGDPTPCSEYDVATLVGHLQAVVRRIGAVVRGEHFSSVPMVVPSTDWGADWESGRAGTDAALAAADLDQVVTVPWGEAPLGVALGTYVTELATHAWDLAVATDRVGELDPDIAEAALPIARIAIPAQIRALPEIPFGPVVEVAEDAPAHQRLAGWNGRDPHWVP